MDREQYDRELEALGITGPVCEVKVDGAYYLIYKAPDKTSKRLLPPDMMSPAERIDTINMLKGHLGVIELNRNGDSDKRKH